MKQYRAIIVEWFSAIKMTLPLGYVSRFMLGGMEISPPAVTSFYTQLITYFVININTFSHPKHHYHHQGLGHTENRFELHLSIASQDAKKFLNKRPQKDQSLKCWFSNRIFCFVLFFSDLPLENYPPHKYQMRTTRLLDSLILVLTVFTSQIDWQMTRLSSHNWIPTSEKSYENKKFTVISKCGMQHVSACTYDYSQVYIFYRNK